MTTRARRLLLFGQRGAAPVEWQLFDDYLADQNPLTQPRNADPGPGVWPTVNASLYTDGGLLYAGATGARGMVSSAFTPSAGQAVIIRGYNTHYTGWYTNFPSTFAATVHPDSIRTVGAGHQGVEGGWSFTTMKRAAIVHRQARGYWIIVESALLWVEIPYTGNVQYGVVFSSPRVGPLDYFGVRQLPAPFTDDYGLATFRHATPTSGAEYTGNANGITELTVTAPNPLDGDANTRCGLYYRTDADLTPAWHAYFNGAGAFRLDSIAADGTRTNRINVASVIGNGNTRTIWVHHNANTHRCYTTAGSTTTARGSTITVSLNDDVNRVIPVAPSGWSLGSLVSWPRELSPTLVAELYRT